MKIEIESSPSHTTIVPRGDLETEAAEKFLEAVRQVQANGTPRVVLFMRYVKYINSTALGAIVRARRGCIDQGGDLVIAKPAPLCREIILGMGLDSVLRIFADVDSAAHFLSGGEAAPQPARAATSDESNESVVMFSFEDERAELFSGKSHRGVAILDAVDARGLTFHWNPTEHGADAATAAAMFRVGSTMRNKLQLKLARKGFFEAESTIDHMTADADGNVTVKASWSKIASTDLDALTQYVADLEYLGAQSGNEG